LPVGGGVTCDVTVSVSSQFDHSQYSDQ